MIEGEKRKDMANCWWVTVGKGAKWDVHSVKTVHRNWEDEERQRPVLKEEVKGTTVRDELQAVQGEN